MTATVEGRPRLKHVRFTRAKGNLYAYFDTGRRNRKNRPIYTPLPRFGTDEFYQCYAKLANAREAPRERSFDMTKLERAAAAARRAAEAAITQTRKQYIYFVQAPDGQIKIGISSDPQNRIMILQVSHHGKLRQLAITEGNDQAEKAYHRRFEAHRLKGEWFWPHPEILAEVKRLNDENKARGRKPDRKLA